MTNIEQKALELVNEIEREGGVSDITPKIMRGLIMDEALCRAIEQHEAFRQEVSDALEKRGFYIDDRDLGGFIIAKPDPLVEAVKDILDDDSLHNADEFSEAIRAALAKRGGRIVFDDM